MSQSHPRLSFSSARLSLFTLPSAVFLTALLLMGLWMVKGTTTLEQAEVNEQADVNEQAEVKTAAAASAFPATIPQSAQSTDEAVRWQVANEQDIPFPLYPNATRYRIGGQNGLKLALFETTDEFGEVDHFYAEKATKTGLLRQQIMSDYVQYGEHSTDQPAISEDNPGVLIYSFFDAKEAREAGATANARTSIIISYR